MSIIEGKYYVNKKYFLNEKMMKMFINIGT